MYSVIPSYHYTTIESRKSPGWNITLKTFPTVKASPRFTAFPQRRPTPAKQTQEWELVAESEQELRVRRRAYDCEIIVLHHRARGANDANDINSTSNNNASLSAAFQRLRARTRQQRRAREWVSTATGRRDARLLRAAFGALARAGRSRAAMAATATARCRAGLTAWRRAVSVSRAVRFFRRRRDRAKALEGLSRWRQQAGWAVVGIEARDACEWKLELFRERRAKRVVFRAWRDFVETAAAVKEMEMETGMVVEGEIRNVGGLATTRLGISVRGRRQGGVVLGRRRGKQFEQDDELEVCPEWGARLRTAEVCSGRER